MPACRRYSRRCGLPTSWCSPRTTAATPTTSTDHSREYIPILCWGNRVIPRTNIGTRQTFADIAATAAEFFGLDHRRFGVLSIKRLRRKSS